METMANSRQNRRAVFYTVSVLALIALGVYAGFFLIMWAS